MMTNKNANTNHGDGEFDMLTMRDGRIDRYLFDEGYCQAMPSAINASQDYFTFYYYDRDHLGSVRQVILANGTNKGTLVQKMDYYPSGLRFCDGNSDGDVQPVRFSGKELDRMHGLGTYDFGARQYNPVTMRWDKMDPLCEKYYSVSPYAYCGGDPVNFVDPDGRDWFKYQGQGESQENWHWHEGKSYTYTNVNGKEQTINNGYEYLSVFVKTGTKEEGASTGSLLLFHQQHPVAYSSTAFSGGNGFTPIQDGEYEMNLSLRRYNSLVTMRYNEDEGWNPEPFWGLEQFPNGGREIRNGQVGMNYPTRLAYGNSRIRLAPLFSSKDRGLYIHGKTSDLTWTHGCLCDKNESIQQFFISGGGKDYRGIVPLSVFHASSLGSTDSYVQFIKRIIGW